MPHSLFHNNLTRHGPIQEFKKVKIPKLLQGFNKGISSSKDETYLKEGVISYMLSLIKIIRQRIIISNLQRLFSKKCLYWFVSYVVQAYYYMHIEGIIKKWWREISSYDHWLLSQKKTTHVFCRFRCSQVTWHMVPICDLKKSYI